MAAIDDFLARFDAATSCREFSMRLGGYSPAEVAEFVSYRETRRAELVKEMEAERVIWRR